MDTNAASHSLPPRTMDESWKKYLALSLAALVVLVAGIFIGSGLAIMYFGRMLVQRPTSPETAAGLITTRLSSSVSLSPEERNRTEELVQRQMAEVAGIRKRYENEIKSKLGSMQDGLTEILGRERMNMCGDWMRRYPGRPADEKNENGAECCCDGSGPAGCCGEK